MQESEFISFLSTGKVL